MNDDMKELFGFAPIPRELCDLPALTDAEVATYAWLAAERRATHQQRLQQHAYLLATTTGIPRAVLELHGPATVSYRHEEVCLGCDLDGFSAEPPTWPCRTWTAAQAEETT